MPNFKPNVFDGQKISANEFFKTHWQRLPYLFTNTQIDLSDLPGSKTLFEIAAKDDVQSRIIYTEDQRHYKAIYDDPDAWTNVEQYRPTLLVSDIEKWYPQALRIMDWFPFIKNWRFDDLMMSFAPTGSSVGAHTDHYDVFLVQVQGTRQWSYSHQPLVEPKMVDDSELAVIDQYSPEFTHELKAGDVLYLPPEIPHHGVSLSDDCITCSIGLRAPSQAELITAITDLIAQSSNPNIRFKDDANDLLNDSSIGSNEIEYLRRTFIDMSQLEDRQLAELFGQYVTGYRLFDEIPEWSNQTSNQDWKKNPFAIFAYHRISNTDATLFVNGEQYESSLPLAQLLSDQTGFQLSELKKLANNRLSDHRIINDLIESGAIINNQ